MIINQLPNKGTPIEIHASGIYVEQMGLFKDYCKIVINGRQITVPIEIITMEKEDVSLNQKSG